MRISLEEYAKAHPMQNPDDGEEIAAAGREWKDRQIKKDLAETLKQSVLKELHRGSDPQLILYIAVQCIGLYSGDPAFTQEAQACIDSVYGDQLRRSEATSNAAEAAELLESKRIEYTDKLRRNALRQIKECESLISSFNDILKTIDDSYLQDIGIE